MLAASVGRQSLFVQYGYLLMRLKGQQPCRTPLQLCSKHIIGQQSLSITAIAQEHSSSLLTTHADTQGPPPGSTGRPKQTTIQTLSLPNTQQCVR